MLPFPGDGVGGAGIPVDSEEMGWDLDEDHQKYHRKESRHDDIAPVVCFIRGSAFARRGSLRFREDTVPVKECTHIVYSFLETKNDTGHYIFRKRGVNKEDETLQLLVRLKERKRQLKVLFSYGEGAHANSLLKQLRSKETQEGFVERTVKVISYLGLDGVNFHLEGPGPSVCDKRKWTKILNFIKALRAASGPESLITFQLPAYRKQNCAPPKKELARHLDYLFLMTFDYKLDDLSRTKLTSGLYFHEGDRETSIDTESCLDRWINDGVPKYKLIPGIATYGRTFTLNNPANNGVNAKTKKDHPLGYGANFTKTDGYMDYIETCRRVKHFNWKRKWVNYAATPYIYYEDQWISYDDVDSVDVKAKWFRAHWFGGIFVWSVDADDYLGNCGGELFPMVHAAWKAFKGYRPLASKGEVDITMEREKNSRKRKKPDTAGPYTRVTRGPPKTRPLVTRGPPKTRPLPEKNCSHEKEDGSSSTPPSPKSSRAPTDEDATDLGTDTPTTPKAYPDGEVDATPPDRRHPRCPICPCTC